MTIDYFFKEPSNWNPLKLEMVNLQKAIEVTNSKLDVMANPYY